MFIINHYIVTKRARFDSISGEVNLPYGTEITEENGYLRWMGKVLCSAKSQNARIYFSFHQDGKGEERGRLIRSIQRTLAKRDAQYQARWDRIWNDPKCQPYKCADMENFWTWNHAFFTADIQDLQYIDRLVRVKGESNVSNQ